MMKNDQRPEKREQEFRDREKAVEERERELREREKAVEERERKLGPVSQAVQNKKEEWYDKVKLSVRQIDTVIWIVSGLLVAVLILIILEAAGIFKIV